MALCFIAPISHTSPIANGGFGSAEAPLPIANGHPGTGLAGAPGQAVCDWSARMTLPIANGLEYDVGCAERSEAHHSRATRFMPDHPCPAPCGRLRRANRDSYRFVVPQRILQTDSSADLRLTPPLSPFGAPQRRLDALATKGCEKCRLARNLAAAALVVLLTVISGCGGKNRSAVSLDRQDAELVPPKARHGNHVFAGGVPPPEQPLENPFQDDAQSIESGATLFNSMNCDGCHGSGAMGAVGPSLADGRWRYGGSNAEIFESIYAGRPNGMPAYGGVLSKEALWLLVTYLRSLTPQVDPATVSFEEKKP
jgi:mono/diheme cytochrome c family protein